MDDYLGSLKSLITRGMFRAITAHKEIFRDNPNISIALAYLNSATSYFVSAEALYYSNPETYENIFLTDVFHCFSVFEKEFLDNVRTNHSYQWTDIEFQRLRDSFMSSPFRFKDEKLFS